MWVRGGGDFIVADFWQDSKSLFFIPITHLCDGEQQRFPLFVAITHWESADRTHPASWEKQHLIH